MKIILLERIARLGQVGDIVQVKNGYARNYLLPKGKAMRANPANIKHFEAERAHIEARNLELQKEAEDVAERLNGQTLVIIRRAGQTGQLYGSVNSRDIVQGLEEIGFHVERAQIQLAGPIKSVGLHSVLVALFADITASITVNVARNEEEAERQAKGEDVRMADQAPKSTESEDEGPAPEEVFEEGAPALAEAETEAEPAPQDESEEQAPSAQ